MESGAVALFPLALFLFAENPVAATPCCRIDLLVSLAEHEGVLVTFFLDLMEESVARPSVGEEDLCSLGMLYCLKRSAETVFVCSVGCRRPVGSDVHIKARGAREQDVCRVHTGVLSLWNDAALEDASAILAMDVRCPSRNT